MGLVIICPGSYTAIISAPGSRGGATVLMPACVSVGVFHYALRASTLLLGDKNTADDHGVFGQDVGGQRQLREAIAVVQLGFRTQKNGIFMGFVAAISVDIQR